jgi:hypothetical protein
MLLTLRSADPTLAARLLPGNAPSAGSLEGGVVQRFAQGPVAGLRWTPDPGASPSAPGRLAAALAAATEPLPASPPSTFSLRLAPLLVDPGPIFSGLGYAIDVETHGAAFAVELSGEASPAALIEQLRLLLPLLDAAPIPEAEAAALEEALRKAGPWMNPHRAALAERLRPRARRPREAPVEAVDHRAAELRVAAVVTALRGLRARRVAELPCGEGRLCKALLADPTLVELIALDPNPRALELAARRLPADERLRLLSGLAWAEDPRLGGVDAVVVTDILGALSAGHRALLGRALLEKLRPPALLFTIPPAADPASALTWAQGQPGYTFRAEPIGENGRAGSLLVGRRCS